MPLKKLTKWTPELRASFFKYSGKNSWDLDRIINETGDAIKLSRKHMGRGSIEHLNYLKAKKQSAQEEMNRIIAYHGKDKLNDSLKGTSIYALKAPDNHKIDNKTEKN